MATPPPALQRFERAVRQGDHAAVVASGDHVADELSAAGRTELIPEVLLQVGAAHAALDRFEAAAVYLGQGLAMADELTPAPTPPAPNAAVPAPPPPQVGPAAPSGPFGRPAASPRSPAPVFTAAPAPGLPGAPPGGLAPQGTAARRAARTANRFDWFELALLDVELRLGRYEDVLARAPRLTDPSHEPDVRFTATRAQAAVLGAQGQFEGAHHLLNTAGGLASRIRSRFRIALVEGDRAVLFARQGRLLEAITNADRVLPSLIRPTLGEYQLWSNAEGAAVALTVSQVASAHGDHLSAQRLLLLGTTATQHLGSAYLAAHLDLARGSFWLLERDLDAAEAALVSAARQFGVLGCEPAVARATFEQGRLAQARGLARSARPLYERALADFRRLGQPREANEIARLLGALG